MTIQEDPARTTTATAPLPSAQRRPGLNTDTLALGALFVALFAFLAAVLAVGIATRAADEHRALGASPGAVAPAADSTTIALSEFSIAPGDLALPAGTTRIEVRNDGAIVHNLSVDGIASPMLNGGEAGELDLGALEAGTYTMRCDVPGHEAAGMKGTLTIG